MKSRSTTARHVLPLFGVSVRSLLLLLLCRVAVCFTLRASSAPDEWWQSTEVAYHMVFGKGHLTWEWDRGIRSVFFPSFFALPFYLLKITGLDSANAVYASFKLVQSLITFGVDCATLAIARQIDLAIGSNKSPRVAGTSKGTTEHKAGLATLLFPTTVAQTTLILSVANFGYTFEGLRCYSNVAEALFVLWAFSQENYTLFLCFAGLACVVRVTAVIPLAFLFLLHLWRLLRAKGTGAGLRFALARVLVLGPAFLLTMMCVDHLFYGRWIVTAYEFLYENVFMSVSEFYGTHPWYWYFVSGFPAMVGPSLALLLFLPFPLATCRDKSVRLRVGKVVALILWTLTVNSPLKHKEMRFIFPVLPLALVLGGFTVVQCCRPQQQRPQLRRLVRLVYVATLLINVALIVLVTYGYRCGALSATAAVRHSHEGPFRKVDAYVGCYLTPGLSHMHRQVEEIKLIDCDMVVDHNTRQPVPTEQSLYVRDPVAFFYWRYARKRIPLARSTAGEADALPIKDRLLEADYWREAERLLPEQSLPEPLPDAFIMFAHVAEKLKEEFLLPQGYQLSGRFFHAFRSFEPAEDTHMDLWIRRK